MNQKHKDIAAIFQDIKEMENYIRNAKSTGGILKILRNLPESSNIITNLISLTPYLNGYNADITTRVYYLNHNLNTPIVCNICGSLLQLSILRHKGKYCSRFCYYSATKSDETKIKTSVACKKTWSTISEENKIARYKKVAENNIKKYSTKCTLNLPENIKKKKQTWLDKYGYDNPNKAIEVKQKTIKTNIEKYGVVSPSLLTNPYKRWKNFHSYIMPDGREFKIQGWEQHALELYLLKQYNPHDIEHDMHFMHNFHFTYIDNDNFTHQYYPDFYIKSINTFIEVKSTFTLYNNIERNLKKFEAVINAGYNLIICLIHKKSNKYTYELLTYEDIKNKKKDIRS